MIVLILAASLVLLPRTSATKEPPSLPETVPFVSNAYQYLNDVGGFMDRVSRTMQAKRCNIVKFYMGGMKGYIVTGTKNIQAMFGSQDHLDGNWLQLILMEKHWEMSKDETQKFRDDKSGRLDTRAAGTEGVPDNQRYWHGHSRLYADFLTQRKHCDALADSFYRFFTEQMEMQSQDWTTVSLFETLKSVVAESATRSFFGLQIIKLNPGLVQCYWDFDVGGGKLVWGLPRWLKPGPYVARECLHKMTRNYIDFAWENADRDVPDKDWDPIWGSRLSRETAKWLRDSGFSNKAAAGHVLGTLFGLHGNTIPITAWALMELIKDPALFQAVREEVMQAYKAVSDTGKHRIDAQKLVSLPLLQSIYIEILRLHVSFTVTRNVLKSLSIDGYQISEGSLLQANTEIAHLEEAVWGTEEHPAFEFWAARHIKYVDMTDETGNVVSKPQFAMRGRPSSFFPFGGGQVICPGRHFAKQEIMMAIAIVIAEFDIEFLEWTTLDGQTSDRQAKDDRSYAGVIAMPPDRDMKIRWRRR